MSFLPYSQILWCTSIVVFLYLLKCSHQYFPHLLLCFTNIEFLAIISWYMFVVFMSDTSSFNMISEILKGPGGSMSQVVGLVNNTYKPITNTAQVRARLCKLQKECTRLAAASNKVYQLLASGRWFSPGTPASFTTKTGLHDIAEILLKVALNTKSQKTKPKS